MAPTTEEIEEQNDRAQQSISTDASRWPGMTYEEGVAAALAWMTGDSDEPPIED